MREVGLIMARDDVDLVPIVDDDGALAGVMTERALARRYVRESREASRLDAPTAVGAIAGVLEGEQLVGEPSAEISGRVWVLAMATASLPLGFEAGRRGRRRQPPRRPADRDRGRRRAARHEQRHRGRPTTSSRSRASAGIAVVASPLDSYVTSRMITLSAPCRALMDREPARGRAPTTWSPTSPTTVKDVDYRAAVVVDADRRPIGLVTRSDLVEPASRGASCSSTTPSRRRA